VHRGRRWPGFLAAIALLTGTVAADGPALTVLHIASAPDDDVTPVLWAERAGLFRAAGLTVQITSTRSGSTVATSVVGGSIDIGKSSLLPIVLAHARGVPLTIVAPGILYQTTSVQSGLLVTKDSPIHSARDLDGKTVSVPGLNDLQWLSVQAWIDKNGGNSKRVQFIEQPATSVGIALDSGRIAAGALQNPAYSQDLATGRYRNLGRPVEGISSRLMVSAWFADADWVAKNTDVVRKFSEIMNRASAYAGAHHDETVDLLAGFSGMEPATIRSMVRAVYVPVLDPALIQPLIDTAAKYGSIPAAFDARELFSPYAYRK
jgi:NitT/TauT family transport system substrate-binding protein